MSDSQRLREGARHERLLPNAWLVAKRELRERVFSRLFLASTLLLAILAVGVSMTPVIVRVIDRGTTATIAIAAADDEIASRTISILGGV
ncbi:MAG TPA: hypothetical protein VET90_05105, partial [Candidatus Binatus sp.]|nr:hypothetical protein [Candidatus Binatus sp.]